MYDDHVSLVLSKPTIAALGRNMVLHKDLDFSKLRDVEKNYATQTSIPQARVNIFLVCAILYNFN